MELNELKAKAYDLFIEREKLHSHVAGVIQQLNALLQEIEKMEIPKNGV